MSTSFLQPLGRQLIFPLAAVALLFMSGCVDDPLFGDDFRTVYESPHYLRQAYVYSGRDAAVNAQTRFDLQDYRLYGLVGFGTYYPGCAPGVGERLARRHGSVVLADTGKPILIDTQEYYFDKATVYAAAYNAEMVHLLGSERHR